MEKKQGILVDGFLFREKALAEKAERELDGIKYIRNNTDMNKPQTVLQLYDRILEQELFETPVGIGYLRELQDYLYTIPSIPKQEIRPIPVESIIRKEFVPAKASGSGQDRNGLPNRAKEPAQTSGGLRLSIAGNVVLILAVIAMFVIANTGSHPNVLNYKEKLLNQYSSWEQNLKEREREVRIKEQELGIVP